MPDLTDPSHPMREVNFEHSRDFVGLLQELGVSLLVSTYQAGKVAVLGTNQHGLALHFHNFEQAMGCAVGSSQLAIGSKTQIWLLEKSDPVVPQLAPELQHDACYLTRKSHVTDSIDIHEMQWIGDELWFVNTRFSCLCTLDDAFSFVPRWRPPFISQLAAEDRCHLNGLCVDGNGPRYVTAMSETDEAEGWRPNKATSGCIIDVTTGEAVARGFAMPHSPRIVQGKLLVLDSGRGQLTMVDATSGKAEPICQQPGYTRGLAFAGPYAFVGLSRIRETSTFGGVPIAKDRDQLKCAVAVVDMTSGKRVAYFEFLSGVEEIFDVQVIPDSRNPYLTGPASHLEGGKPVWYAPTPNELPTKLVINSTTDTANTDAVFANASISDSARLAFQRGNELADQDRFEDAIGEFQKAIKDSPTFGDAICNLGLAQQYVGRIELARATLNKALSVAPRLPAAHINLATTLFLSGDLNRAWHEYEWRWKCARFKKRPQAANEIAPPWDGSSLAGRTLLVYGEQGIGDEVMFSSCLPELIAESARCIVACEARLVPLFQRSFPNADVVSVDQLARPAALEQLGRVDYQIAAGSVPRFTRPTPDQFSKCEKFLRANETHLAEFRQRLNQHSDRLKVGISWRGGAIAEEQRRRSTTLDQWASIFEDSAVDFVNLQYGDTEQELRAVRERSCVDILDWPDVDPLIDVDRFVSLVAALDCVVTIDNSTLHFAGAVGTPTLGLVSFPSSSYWRWFANGRDTVWYPSVTLIRRHFPQSWEDSFREAASLLAELSQQKRADDCIE